jgi:uncharacterized lipoprotein YmbA
MKTLNLDISCKATLNLQINSINAKYKKTPRVAGTWQIKQAAQQMRYAAGIKAETNLPAGNHV